MISKVLNDYWAKYDKIFNKCLVSECRNNESISQNERCENIINSSIISKCQKKMNGTDDKKNFEAFKESGKCYAVVCYENNANQSAAICKLHFTNERENKIFASCPKYVEKEKKTHKAHSNCLKSKCKEPSNKDLPMCFEL